MKSALEASSLEPPSVATRCMMPRPAEQKRGALMTPHPQRHFIDTGSRVAVIIQSLGLLFAYGSALAGLFGMMSALRVALFTFSGGLVALIGTAIYFVLGGRANLLTFEDRNNPSGGR